MIVQELQDIQDRCGYLPESELVLLARKSGEPLCRIQEVASFFSHFRRQLPCSSVQICRDMACHLRGSTQLLHDSREFVAKNAPGQVEVEAVSCLGRCDRAPVAFVDRPRPEASQGMYTELDRGDLKRNMTSILSALASGGTLPTPDRDRRDDDKPDWKIDIYDARKSGRQLPPFSALKKYLQDRTANDPIPRLESAGLLGMGGALGQAGKKWQAVRNATGEPKYVVANGDESEPGTFKDRELLLHCAHLVVEGIILSGLCLNAAKGFIYIRHEYQEQVAAVKKAIAQARLEAPEAFKSFELAEFVSPGRYICGEQSALLEVLEDRRAQPRNSPPEIATNGLYDKPTLVNNVETFAWVPGILFETKDWYQRERLFSISGDVAKPGVFEMQMDRPLDDLIAKAGGLPAGQELKAIAPSGPSGGFLPATWTASQFGNIIEASLERQPRSMHEIQDLREALRGKDSFAVTDLLLNGSLFRDLGFMLGAGIIVYAHKKDTHGFMMDHALNCLEFFHKESCGKCVPCRLGCENLVQIATDMHRRPQKDQELKANEEKVRELAGVMEITSICSLGRVAANPLTSMLEYFRDDVTGPPVVEDAI